MSKRMQILEQSLEKKNAKLNAKFDEHFSTVALANGQPLNDKRNGAATLAKWERQKGQNHVKKNHSLYTAIGR